MRDRVEGAIPQDGKSRRAKLFLMQSLYKNSPQFPYHISVGAVFFNNNNEIACEVFSKEVAKKWTGLNTEIRTLMRETIEVGEDIIDAVHRGILEEFGVSGTIIGPLGSKEDLVVEKEKTFLKTTLYFLVKADHVNNIPLQGVDGEIEYKIEWLSIDDLIEKMTTQSQGLEREDLNEVKILERAKKYL